MLNFEAYHLNDFWTVYHNKKQASLNYDFTLELMFRDIMISPEHVYEKEFVKEKQIKSDSKSVPGGQRGRGSSGVKSNERSPEQRSNKLETCGDAFASESTFFPFYTENLFICTDNYLTIWLIWCASESE